MNKRLSFRDSDPRVRVLRGGEHAAKSPEFVLYWCQIFRRGTDNAALEYALARANELDLPLVVYEAIRPDYPFASERFHTFVLEGAKETAARLEARGIRHVFFLPRTPDEARGVVAKLAARAALVVTDDSPTLIAAHSEAAARRIACPLVAIDDCAVVPLALFPKAEYMARTLRPKMHRALPDWLLPLAEGAPKRRAPARLDLPFEPVDLGRADVAKLVAACAIDHEVGAVAEFPGGSAAAEARLEAFLRRGLAAYLEDHNDPSRDATSHLSPYLHFGMISARRVALSARTDGEARGASDGLEAFLEQLLVRRGLAYNLARNVPAHATFGILPAWARATLEEHARDPRPSLVSREDLEAARSPDELWNAAQLELRARGVIHNYLRMLWGKLVLTWTARPEDAHATLVYLNDRWALDGRDPDGYANISWCFGLHDRPWPSRPVFGTVRSMTSRSARQKLDVEGYLDRARSWRHA